MEHIERMKAIRAQVNTIIEQTETLNGLDAHLGSHIGATFLVERGVRESLAYSVRVPVDELRAMLQRRIDEADAEIRKLGMVAPAPAGSSVLDRVRQQPGIAGPPLEPAAVDERHANAPCDLANPGS